MATRHEARHCPLENARHVRSAIARFNHVTDVTDAERGAAWGRITRAARTFDVHLSEGSWREIGAHPHGKR
jgi:hypothetical protein